VKEEQRIKFLFPSTCSELSGYQCVEKEGQRIKFLFPRTSSELSGHQCIVKEQQRLFPAHVKNYLDINLK
jgi:hypothetical protein